MATITCPNCGSSMNSGDSCPECSHSDDGYECDCAFCQAHEEEARS